MKLVWCSEWTLGDDCRRWAEWPSSLRRVVAQLREVAVILHFFLHENWWELGRSVALRQIDNMWWLAMTTAGIQSFDHASHDTVSCTCVCVPRCIRDGITWGQMQKHIWFSLMLLARFQLCSMGFTSLIRVIYFVLLYIYIYKYIYYMRL